MFKLVSAMSYPFSEEVFAFSSTSSSTWGVRRSENDFFDLFNLPHPGKYVVRIG